MRVLRNLMRVVIGLFSVILGALLLPTDDYAGTLAVLGLFVIGAVLVLGPWWPKDKWRLKLPTDDPRIANISLSAFVAMFAFYQAWDAYVNPDPDFRRVEKTIVALLGRDGVTAFWIVIGFACLGATITFYKKRRHAA
jgi:hypothetical protein